MLFLEALTQLKAGKAMRRSAWKAEEGYLKLMPGMNYVWKIVLHPNPNAGNFIFSIDEFIADDWEEYIVPAAPLEAIVEDSKTEAA